MLADDQLVQDHAQRIDVGALRERGPRRALLGRHVAGRPRQHVQIGVDPGNGDAEVGNPHLSAVVDQNVRRLEVAVQHAACVRGGQPAGQLAGDVHDLLGWHAADAAKQRGEVFAGDELHRVEHDAALGLADVEHPADRGMRDLPRQANLVEQPRPRVWTGRVDHLQRHRHLQDQIVGAPDVAHAAAPDARDHPVPSADDLARLEPVGRLYQRAHARGQAPAVVLVLDLVVWQQRLDFATQFLVARTGLGDERGALGSGAFQRSEKNFLRPLVQRTHFGKG